MIPEKKRKKKKFKNVIDLKDVIGSAKKKLGKNETGKDALKVITKNLENVGNSDKVMKTMLRMVLSTIAIAELNYKSNSSDRNAYALNTLIEAAKHLLEEIESRGGRKKLLEKVNPLITELSDELIKQTTLSIDILQKSLVESKGSKKLITDSLKVFMGEFGKALKDHYSSLIKEVENVAFKM